MCRIRTGKIDANEADVDGLYPFFTCAVGTLRINTPAFDTKAILVAGNGDLNVKYYEGKFNAYQRTYVIESRDEANALPMFLYAFLDLYVGELRKLAIGGVIKYIKLPYLTEAVVPLPAISAQRSFVARLKSAERIRTSLNASSGQSAALFASLQDRAFRGAL
ncbi:MAG: restriction endonuclease subunit S [Planctomycetes bacterium]|nr:restriction endonuclease subunit S [Planctomycetota bacterium]